MRVLRMSSVVLIPGCPRSAPATHRSRPTSTPTGRNPRCGGMISPTAAGGADVQIRRVRVASRTVRIVARRVPGARRTSGLRRLATIFSNIATGWSRRPNCSMPSGATVSSATPRCASRIKAARRAIGDDGPPSAHRHRARRGLPLRRGGPRRGCGSRPRTGRSRNRGHRRRDPHETSKSAIAAPAVASRIAYAATGSGPPLVKAANWLTHLDLEWDSPSGRTGSTHCPRGTGWCATTSAAAACPTGMSASSVWTPG